MLLKFRMSIILVLLRTSELNSHRRIARLVSPRNKEKHETTVPISILLRFITLIISISMVSLLSGKQRPDFKKAVTTPEQFLVFFWN